MAKTVPIEPGRGGSIALWVFPVLSLQRGEAAVLRVIPPSAPVAGGFVNEIVDFFLASSM